MIRRRRWVSKCLSIWRLGIGIVSNTLFACSCVGGLIDVWVVGTYVQLSPRMTHCFVQRPKP